MIFYFNILNELSVTNCLKLNCYIMKSNQGTLTPYGTKKKTTKF